MQRTLKRDKYKTFRLRAKGEKEVGAMFLLLSADAA